MLHVVENVLIHTERIVSDDARNPTSAGAIQLVGGVVERQVGVGDTRIGNHPGVKTKLPGHPLPVLFCQCGPSARK